MTSSKSNILIVDDDHSLRLALRSTLTALGFAVDEATTGEDAILKARAHRFDAVLLDLNMPGMGGMSTCKELRLLLPSLQIVLLTVRDNQDDVVRAFEAGADDYVTKPFHIRELTARLRAAVRRARTFGEPSPILTSGALRMDIDRRTVHKAGAPIHLTPKEFDLLHQLMLQVGMPVSHAKLLRTVWGPEYGGELEYLRTFIRQLRIKIEDSPSDPVYLLTEPFIGYRFADETQVA